MNTVLTKEELLQLREKLINKKLGEMTENEALLVKVFVDSKIAEIQKQKREAELQDIFNVMSKRPGRR